MKTNVLICIYDNIARHPRVQMEIDSLKSNYHVTCAGFGKHTAKDYEYVNIEQLFAPNYKRVRFKVKNWMVPFVYRLYRILFFKTYNEIALYENSVDYFSPRLFDLFTSLKPQVFVIHHPYLLPLAAHLKQHANAKIIFNAHEFYPDVLGGEKEWDEVHRKRITAQLEKYLPVVEVMFTISKGIQQQYIKVFNKNSVLVTNAKPFYDLHPATVDPNNIRLVHHGSSVPIRKLENILELVNFLPRNYSLYMYLYPAYEEYHKSLIDRYGKHERIKFMPVAPTNELPLHLNQYDIGVCLLPSVNFNLEMTLPNKFFEFIQARNAIVSGPSPELTHYIHKYDLGIVASTFEPRETAQAILSLDSDQIMHFKNCAHKSAIELSYAKELELIRSAVENILKID